MAALESLCWHRLEDTPATEFTSLQSAALIPPSTKLILPDTLPLVI